jgi:hypothetical protein
MTWFAWRQLRFPALIVLGFLVVMAVFFAITGPHLWSLYDGMKTCHAHGDCQSVKNTVLNAYTKSFPIVQTLSVALPAILGVFWGAPLIAHELETGTYRLAWTQGVTRARWVFTKLVVVGGLSMLAVGLVSWMVTWWSSPVDTLNASRLSTTVFDSAYIAPIGYAAFGFALGVAAGVLWRRTVPAMATTMVAFAAVRLPFTHFLRPRLMSPVTQNVSLKQAGNFGFERGPSGLSFVFGDPAQSSSLIVSDSVVGNNGGSVTQRWLRDNCHSLLNLGQPTSPKGAPTGVRPTAFNDCIDKVVASFHQVVIFQPASRFWSLQWIELAIYVVAAVLLGAFSYWWVRRRIT